MVVPAISTGTVYWAQLGQSVRRHLQSLTMYAWGACRWKSAAIDAQPNVTAKASKATDDDVTGCAILNRMCLKSFTSAE
jgi:hypothetical protein